MFINAVNDKLNGKTGTECLSNVGIPPKALQSTLALIVQVFIKPFSDPSSPVDGGTIGVTLGIEMFHHHAEQLCTDWH